MTAPPTSSADTIVVALDGSPAAASALPVARALAARLGARLEMLHVSPPPPHGAGALRPTPDVAGCADYQVRVRSGDPVAEILRAGDNPAVALVVMATHTVAPSPSSSSWLLAPVPQAATEGALTPNVVN